MLDGLLIGHVALTLLLQAQVKVDTDDEHSTQQDEKEDAED
jgi:hypothetical protein